MKVYWLSMYCAWCKIVIESSVAPPLALESQIVTAKDNLAADPSSRNISNRSAVWQRMSKISHHSEWELWDVQKARCSIRQQLNVIRETFLYHSECNILMPTHGMQEHWVVAMWLTLILLLLWRNLGQTVTVRHGKQPVAREDVDSETQSDYEHS